MPTAPIRDEDVGRRPSETQMRVLAALVAGASLERAPFQTHYVCLGRIVFPNAKRETSYVTTTGFEVYCTIVRTLSDRDLIHHPERIANVMFCRRHRWEITTHGRFVHAYWSVIPLLPRGVK